MSSALTRWAENSSQFMVFLVLAWLYIALDRWWQGSVLTSVVHYVYLIYMPLWLAARTWVGYLRRKPYWTRESWLRFLRLMAWPVVALVVLFAILFAFESSRDVFGAPKSALRALWVLVMLALMGIGAVGLPIGVDWLVRGEPSDQFMRTRWIPWRARPN